MGFGGSGGGSSGISTSNDVALNNPANNNVLAFDTSTSKWKNSVARDTTQPYTIYYNATNSSWPTPTPPAGYALDYYVYDSYHGSAYSLSAAAPTAVHTGDVWCKPGSN